MDSGSHSPATDGEAIELAMRYLVTSVVDDRGRGQGPYTTAEEVVEMDGLMVVRSGNAKLSVTRAGTAAEIVPTMRGVIVALNLPLYP